MLDPALFDPAAVSEETRRQNEEIVAKLSSLPDPWSVPAALVRERRATRPRALSAHAPQPTGRQRS